MKKEVVKHYEEYITITVRNLQVNNYKGGKCIYQTTDDDFLWKLFRGDEHILHYEA